MSFLKRLAVFMVTLEPVATDRGWTAEPRQLIPATNDPDFFARMQRAAGALSGVSVASEAGNSDSTAPSLLVFPSESVPAYLRARIHGQPAVLLNRGHQFCRLRLKPWRFFWQRFYYSVLQFLLLPFIRIGIPIRDKLIIWRAHVRRAAEIFRDGRKQSQRLHAIALTLAYQTWLFVYYRAALVGHKLKVLTGALLYGFFVIPGALAVLAFYYAYLLITQRPWVIKQRKGEW